MISLDTKIFVAGHKGLVGSAIVRKLKKKGFRNIILKNRTELDLKNQKEVYNFLKINTPKVIFMAAAKVGGIYHNLTKKADFITENLLIQTNIIHGAYLANIKNIIFLASSCIYPKNCKQPIKEKYLLNGKLEETNDAYAIAKISGVLMCQSYNKQYNMNYKCLMPCNIFGQNDNYDKLNSHFIPALIRKADEIKNKKTKKFIVWGTGKVKREILHVDDLADACVYFMKKKTKNDLINIGTGKDYSIKYYAELISKIVIGKKVPIEFDKSKPSGVKRKVLDISLATKYGWKNKINLNEAILKTYNDYLNRNSN